MTLTTDSTVVFTTCHIITIRDQLNSRFHGRDIFREIDLLL